MHEVLITLTASGRTATAMTDFTRKTPTPDPTAAKAADHPSAGRTPAGMPGFAPFDMSPLLDTVEFARNAWLSFGVPSSLTPTMDPGEVDRRIQDLKTVEQWLSMNLNLLKTSIQALELQRGALAAFQGHAWPPAAASAAAAGQHQDAHREAPGAGGNPYAWPESAPGSFPGGFAGTRASGAPDAPKPSAAADDRPAAEDSPEADGAKAAAAGQAPADVPGLDPSAWWDLLQRQFQQVAAAVLNPGDAEAANGDAPGSAPGSDRRGSSAARAGTGARGKKSTGKKTAARAKKDAAAEQGQGKGDAARSRTRT